MNNSIRIAVCDDLKTERQKIILLLSSYLDQNNLYAEIDEFESGETFLSSDMTRFRKYRLFLPAPALISQQKHLISKRFTIS